MVFHLIFWPWTPMLSGKEMARASNNLCLGKRGDMNVLLSPSKGGYRAVPCPVDLWLHIIDHIHRWWSIHYSIVLVLIF